MDQFSGQNLKKKKVLIVEDDENTRSMYVEIFRKNGFDVIEAVDGVDGLDKATKELPNVIFTGIVMPRMDGFMMFDALKKNVATSQIPVAISSHMGREEDQKKALEMGAKDFIPRDFNTPLQVFERVNSLISQNDFNLKILPNELDGKKFLAEVNVDEKLKCAKCGKDLVLRLTKKDLDFVAKVVCAGCNA